MAPDRIIVIGAGAGGLCAAIDLARQGAEVLVVERAASPGGKMRQVTVDGAAIDAGPTVFTMRWIFEGLFEDAGANLGDFLKLERADILARHAWAGGGRLDLFADIDRSADAIAAFAGQAEADGYRAFCARSADIYATLVQTFIAAERPSSPLDLAWRVGFGQLDALWRTAPMKSMWTAIGENFRDPRLRQLFGRYATYCGSSPLLAPATLMLVAHVEQNGVWLVDGGMKAVAAALVELGERQGARYRFDAHVSSIIVEKGRASGIVLANGERFKADAIVFNGDVSAIASGALGADVQRAVPAVTRADRSLSAITWLLHAETDGFPLSYHNVFFADNYPAEFDAIFNSRTIVDRPTVYVCAEDRRDGDLRAPGGRERLLVLINAPPDGDLRDFSSSEMERYEANAFALLDACGLKISRSAATCTPVTPAHFNALFPATGGALYGRASHGSNATFQRPGAFGKLPGLYFAGGSVHPGPGVPMAAMSGRIVARRVLEDLGSRRNNARPAQSVSVPVRRA